RILSVGGGNSWDVVEVNESGVSGRRCFIYNPVTETWVNTGDLGTPRWTHASIPLLDGRVITTRGYSYDFGYILGTEIPAGTVALPESGSAASIGVAPATDAINNIRVSVLQYLSASDVGRFIVTSGAASASNNGFFRIQAFVNATTVDVENPIGVTPDANNGSVVWRVILANADGSPIL